MPRFNVKYSYTTLEYDEATIVGEDREDAEEAFYENQPWFDNVEVYEVEELND